MEECNCRVRETPGARKVMEAFTLGKMSKVEAAGLIWTDLLIADALEQFDIHFKTHRDPWEDEVEVPEEPERAATIDTLKILQESLQILVGALRKVFSGAMTTTDIPGLTKLTDSIARMCKELDGAQEKYGTTMQEDVEEVEEINLLLTNFLERQLCPACIEKWHGYSLRVFNE